MRCAWLGIFLAAAVAAQEEKKQDDKQAELKAVKDDAVKAMLAAVKSGGFEFAGESKVESEDGDVGNAGKISGAATLPLQAAVTIKVGKRTHEIFHKGGRTAERLAWRGPFPYETASADDVLSLLDFEKLAAAAGKSKKGKTEKDEKIGDVECRVLSLTLQGDAIGKYVEADENAGSDEGFAVDDVELKIRIGKSDGLVLGMEARVRRSYDDGQGGGSTSETRVYSLTFTKHGAAKVEFPAEIRKQLEE